MLTITATVPAHMNVFSAIARERSLSIRERMPLRHVTPSVSDTASPYINNATGGISGPHIGQSHYSHSQETALPCYEIFSTQFYDAIRAQTGIKYGYDHFPAVDNN